MQFRLGEINFRGWLVNPKKFNDTTSSIQITTKDLIPNIQQKGVDMRIGLDIASLTLKNHVDIIVLIAADSDFIPALKFARIEGKQIIIFTLGHSVRSEIYGHTDICVEDIMNKLTNDKEL